MILTALALAAPPPPVANGAPTEAWPAVGAFYAFSEASGGVEVCSGTLVSTRVVVTAAHCKPYLDDYANGGFRVYFLRGPSVDAFTGLTEFAEMTQHPLWNPRTIAWDIGVATLMDEVDDTAPLAIGTDPVDDAWVGLPATVVGWGNADMHGTTSGIKREGVTTISGYSDDSLFTAASAGGAATCPGDSGGAVIREDGAPRLVGVISRGNLDSSDDFPCGTGMGHARVDAAADWIGDQIAASLVEPDSGALPDTGEPVDSASAGDTAERPGGCGCASSSAPEMLGGPAAMVLFCLFGVRRGNGGSERFTAIVQQKTRERSAD